MTRTIAGRIPSQRDRLSSVIADGGVPRIAAEVVPRPRLIESLDRLLPLTVLRAPYGFGKTTLAAQWVTGLELPSSIWVSVEHPGTTAAEFWTSVQHALPPIPGATSSDALRRALEGPGRPLILVIDDLDRVPDPALAEELLGFLRRFPRLHLVATAKADVLDPRTWLDLDGQVLGPEDLAFSPDETKAVLDRLGVGADNPANVTDELGGWPLAVRAFGLALRQLHDADGADETALRTVRDQLSGRILEAFSDAEVHDLVLPSIVIGDFAVAELGALLHRKDAAHDVERLIGQGLTSRGTANQRRFRWPGIVRETVLDTFTRTSPRRVREIRQLLAQRYVQLDDHGRALAHAAEAADWEWIRDHLEASWTVVFQKHYEQLGELLRTAPPGALGDSVRIQSLHAIYTPDLFRIELLRSRVPEDPEEIEELVTTQDPAGLYEIVESLLATLRLQGELEEAAEVARKLPAIVRAAHQAHPDHVNSPGASVSLQCALVWLHLGQIQRAIAELERSHHYGARSIIGHVLRDAASKLAMVHGLLGNHPLSRTWAGRAEAAPLTTHWAKPFVVASLASGKLLNAVSVLDRRAATEAAAQTAVLHSRDELWAVHHYARAKIALYWGHPAAMMRELDAAEAACIPRPAAYMADLLLAARVDLAMKRGLGSKCAALLDASASTSPILQVRRARLALLTGDPVAAFELARAAAEAADSTAATDLEALVVEAVARHRLGDPLAATRLSEALAVAGRRIDAFALVPREELVDLSRQVPGAHAVLDDPRLTAVGEVFPASLTIVALTQREHVVLGHLAQGATLQGIALRETVSINTVKSQVRSLYQKLGATDRDQALQTAAAEGLV